MARQPYGAWLLFLEVVLLVACRGPSLAPAHHGEMSATAARAPAIPPSSLTPAPSPPVIPPATASAAAVTPLPDGSPTPNVSPAAQVPVQPGEPAELTRLYMVTLQHGLVVDASGRILRTLDSGQHWTVATPAGFKLAMRTWYFLPNDRQHVGWIVFEGEIANTAHLLPRELLETPDGGRSFQVRRLPPLPAHADVTDITFVDQEHGWLLVILGAAAGSEPFVIYQTFDGGNHWSVAAEDTGPAAIPPTVTPGSPPFGGDKIGLSFRDQQTGWLAGITGSGLWLYRTHDGGRTWRPQPLAPPLGVDFRPQQVRTDPPHFFDPQNGVLPVEYARADAYVTHDGGARWTATTPLPTAVNPLLWTFLDARHWWASDGSALYATSDAGAHWQAIHPNIALQWGQQLQFLTPQRGWLIVAQDGLAAGALFQTVDGGHTWSAKRAAPASLHAANGAEATAKLSPLPAKAPPLLTAPAPVIATPLAAASGSATPTPPATPMMAAGGLVILALHMFDAYHGLALDEAGQLLFTVDGGSVWQASNAKIVPHLGQAFAVVQNTHVAYVADAGALLVSQDAGRSYRRLPLPPNIKGVYRLSFPDAKHGWIMANVEGFAGSEALDLYRTSDAGRTWSLVAATATPTGTPGPLPFAGDKVGLTFRDDRTGWLACTCGLLRTDDGGRNWIGQALALPSSGGEANPFEFFPPTFFGPIAGIFVLDRDEVAPTGLLVYRTQDGGATWQAGTTLATTPYAPNSLAYGGFVWDFADAADGWVVQAGRLFVTADSGVTWRPVATTTKLFDVWQLDMLTTRLGWAVQYDARRGQLLRTDDGGRTWTALSPRLAAPANAAPRMTTH